MGRGRPYVLWNHRGCREPHQMPEIEKGHTITPTRTMEGRGEAMASSFEHYCRERWQFERRHAYRLIDSARVIENVSHGTQAPESEYVYNCRQTVYRIPSPPPRERWQFARNYANKLIASSQVIENLNKGTIVPNWRQTSNRITGPPPHQTRAGTAETIQTH